MVRILVALFVLCAAPVLAAEEALLSVGLGVTEIDKDQQQGAAALEVVLPAVWLSLHPMAGIHVSREGDAYLYAGGFWEWRPAERWALYLGLAAGVYHDSGGYDLGGPLEFQSRLTLERLLAGGRRLGLTVQHLSNAGFHGHNPGSERLLLTYSLPLD